MVSFPAAREVRGELAEKTCQPSDAYSSVGKVAPTLEHFNSCQKIVQNNSNVNSLQYLFAWISWRCGWWNTKWAHKQLPEKTEMLFSASPGNTTLFEWLDLLLRKDTIRDHTIYVPLPGNYAKYGVHGGRGWTWGMWTWGWERMGWVSL